MRSVGDAEARKHGEARSALLSTVSGLDKEPARINQMLRTVKELLTEALQILKGTDANDTPDQGQRTQRPRPSHGDDQLCRRDGQAQP